MQKVVKLDPRDNVLVALGPLAAHQPVTYNGTTYIPPADVPAKFKFVEHDMPVGSEVIMYGVIVGKVREPIPAGGVVTTRNLQHDASSYSTARTPHPWTPPDVTSWQDRTFLGYHRADGQVGTRNYWLVLPLVFCENRNVDLLREAFEEELGYRKPNAYRRQVHDLIATRSQQHDGDIADNRPVEAATHPIFPNIDGVRFLFHQGGCGGTRQDARALCGLLAGYIQHPNVAGATVLSLGCQNAEISILMEEIRKRDPQASKPLLIFDQQALGLETNMLGRAIDQTFAALEQANTAKRSPAPLTKLTVGLKCGGSDGFSGISANPALGQVSDMLAALGGKSILSEFPELCGAEQGLIDRTISQPIADRFVQLMTTYAARARAVHSGFEMNPSPGNIRDGLITDAMKSAGAARKGGTSPIVDVLDYPEVATTPGLSLLCTPGNDLECVTAQVGAGANIVLFTTGMGTPTGNAIAPVLKVSTNTQTATRMADIIDIDAGSIITGDSTIQKVANEILETVIEVASGRRHTKAELNGQYDFIPWKRGISL
ncbi:MAG TPA: altronate dehydratase [Acidobacteriaceae bacterium]|nr:altronate dehydratase [Acidobacteriaceae bacterium]